MPHLEVGIHVLGDDVKSLGEARDEQVEQQQHDDNTEEVHGRRGESDSKVVGLARTQQLRLWPEHDVVRLTLHRRRD